MFTSVFLKMFFLSNINSASTLIAFAMSVASIFGKKGIYFNMDSPHRLSLSRFNRAPGLKIDNTGNFFIFNASSVRPLVFVYKKIEPLSAPVLESNEKCGIS